MLGAWGDLRAAVRASGHQVVDPLRSVDRAVYVVGSARSGTTWVAETLAGARTTRLVFEPMHHRARAHRDEPIPHLVDGPPTAALASTIRSALDGGVRDPWVNVFQRRSVVARRVVKDIRPGVLPAVLAVAPALAVVLVVRDPLAVARSRARWETERGRWFATPAALAEIRSAVDDEGRVGDLARRAVDVLDGPHRDHPLIPHVAIWCVENRLALDAARDADDPTPSSVPSRVQSRVQVVSYEALRAAPVEGFARIARRAGIPERRLGPHDRPSSTRFDRSGGAAGDARPADADPTVAAPVVAEIAEIVESFGLSDPVPGTDHRA